MNKKLSKQVTSLNPQGFVLIFAIIFLGEWADKINDISNVIW